MVITSPKAGTINDSQKAMMSFVRCCCENFQIIKFSSFLLYGCFINSTGVLKEEVLTRRATRPQVWYNNSSAQQFSRCFWTTLSLNYFLVHRFVSILLFVFSWNKKYSGFPTSMNSFLFSKLASHYGYSLFVNYWSQTPFESIFTNKVYDKLKLKR